MPTHSVSSQPATKADLAAMGDGLRETIRKNTRDIIQYVGQSQAAQDGRIDRKFADVNNKLDALAEDMSKVKAAVVDLLATDRHLHNLVRELKANNIPIDERKVFIQ